MKSEKFTLTKHMRFGRFIKMSMLSALLTLWYSGLQAQCPLVCNNLVQVSMDEDCIVPITYDMMLTGEGAPNCYSVEVLGTNGQVLSTSPNVTRANIGQTLTVRVRSGANSCWGQIKIEDKLPPIITCPDPVTLSCYDAREFLKPIATDNCGGVLPASSVTILSDVTTDLNCDPVLRAKRTIRYQARDSVGNLSIICDRVICYRKITLDSINCPLNFDSTPGNYNHLSCDGTYRNPLDMEVIWDTNGNKYPDVAETGYPYFDDIPGATIGNIIGMLNNSTLCKINVTFTDTRIPICPQSFKVLRAWSILDWCTGTIKTCNQILKVVDEEGPVLTEQPKVPSPFCTAGAGDVISTNPYTCTATWIVDFSKIVIKITDCDTNQKPNFFVRFKKSPNDADPERCNVDPYPDLPFVSSDAVTTVKGTPGLISGANAYRIEGLPLGRTWVRFYVSDACGNETVTTTEIDVIDKTPPVAVCDEFTVVTLSNNGFARVFANTFDDGSHDNCTPVGFQVARMIAGCGNRDENPTSQTIPGPYVQFCCDDLTKQEVDGNRDGVINALDRGYLQVILTVWDDANRDGKYGPPYANANFPDNSNTCMVLIKVEDKVPPIITCPPNVTLVCGADTSSLILGRPVLSATPSATGNYWDNCPNSVLTWSNSGVIDNCGQGVITRTFRVTDSGGRTATCSQTITIRNNDPYTGPLTISLDPLVWKNLEHRDLKGCMNVDTDPAKTGVPDLGAKPCSQVAYTYEDQVFPFVDGVCFKILRKWSVIDWCKFSPNRNPQGATYPSVPTLNTNLWNYTQIIKVTDTIKPVIDTLSKADTDVFTENCIGFVTLKNTAKDCTPSDKLKWKYVIDPGNDGIGPDITGTTNDASGSYQLGTHKITWTVEDQCGNQTTVMYTFRVQDKKKPTPYCLSQLTTVVMPVQGEIEIWARDFDRGSFDNCPGTLRFSSVPRFPVVRNDSLWRFTCADFPSGKDTIHRQLRMYVWDAAQNFDFCTVTLIIQKNTACGGSISGRLAGNIGTEKNDMIKNVQVVLENLGSNETTSILTDIDGRYEFGSVAPNVGFNIRPEKDNDHLNGVSTLDLVMIQRHILNIEKFTSPYKYIASDINNDQKITAGDLIELRKLILGIYSNLPNNKSWRFMDKAANIPDPTNPWNLNEFISIASFNNTSLTNNFMGIKVGDLNSSVSVNVNNEETQTRNKAITLTTKEQSYIAGQLVTMEVKAENVENLAGAQWTLNFDKNNLQLANIESGVLHLNADNVNTLQANTGKIAFSWNDVNGISIDNDKVLFTVQFRATANNTLANSVKISSDITKAEAYTTDLSEINIKFAVKTNTLSDAVFALEQNNPNPFTTQTTISFHLPQAGKASLVLYDITGKVLKTISNDFAKGKNEVIIHADEINAHGVIFYELESNGNKVTKKMIYLSK